MGEGVYWGESVVEREDVVKWGVCDGRGWLGGGTSGVESMWGNIPVGWEEEEETGDGGGQIDNGKFDICGEAAEEDCAQVWHPGVGVRRG